MRWTYYNSLFFSFTAITTIGTCLFWIMHTTTTYLGALSKRDMYVYARKHYKVKAKNSSNKVNFNFMKKNSWIWFHTFCNSLFGGDFIIFLIFKKYSLIQFFLKNRIWTYLSNDTIRKSCMHFIFIAGSSYKWYFDWCTRSLLQKQGKVCTYLIFSTLQMHNKVFFVSKKIFFSD